MLTTRGIAVLGALLAALALPGQAVAAPPPNDNRADSVLLPDFPSNVHGTTAEATVERLDPQVSRCGRIESTVWYRVEAAPDGTIVATAQAAAGFTPVVRIYRRGSSSIQELDCAAANAGGKAVVSVQAVRGAGYLILVGRRPGTADGEFDLRAELFLPPANDERGGAVSLGRPPATVRATTLGATGDASDVPACGMSGGTIWYRLTGPASRRVLLRLSASEELDAVVAVFRPVRSRLDLVACGPTDRKGSLVLGFGARPGAMYLVAVGEQRNSPPGAFSMQLQRAEAPERHPGRALRRGGVRDSVNGLTDVNDVWSVRLKQGTTYRIAFSSSPCARATLHARNRVVRLSCRAHSTFTPGRDGGGRYVVEVTASPTATRQAYRLHIAAAAADDVGVGVELRPGSGVRGSLSPSGVDVLDLYHFDVARQSEVRLRLSQTAGSFGLVVLTDTGSRMAAGGGEFRRRLGRGRYVVAVQGEVGGRAGRYRLSLRLRDVTSTSVLASGRASTEMSPGTSVTLSCLVSPAASGRVELQIDRFDPLTGWHFHRVVRISAGESVSWRPPAAGRWRVRARFLGSARSAPSRSGYAHILVARPIGAGR
ncbi:MAG: hypothetical protein K0S82_599 [Gaiellaceae bacterium]|nr:hypothetical protein [Gaiellaceae bacterium]